MLGATQCKLDLVNGHPLLIRLPPLFQLHAQSIPHLLNALLGSDLVEVATQSLFFATEISQFRLNCTLSLMNGLNLFLLPADGEIGTCHCSQFLQPRKSLVILIAGESARGLVTDAGTHAEPLSNDVPGHRRLLILSKGSALLCTILTPCRELAGIEFSVNISVRGRAIQP